MRSKVEPGGSRKRQPGTALFEGAAGRVGAQLERCVLGCSPVQKEAICFLYISQISGYLRQEGQEGGR